MFTSRAEFRLHLRIDNADRRLTPYGRRLGLINDEAWAEYERKQARMAALERIAHLGQGGCGLDCGGGIRRADGDRGPDLGAAAEAAGGDD
jgi:hypothetical protein